MKSHSQPRRSVVVLMQDEPVERLGLGKAIEDAGFEVAEAVDSNHVGRLVKKFSRRMCAIVADINLPESAKIPAIARRSGASEGAIGLVFTSARDNSDLWALPKSMRIFQKPYAVGALVQHIRKISDREVAAPVNEA
jgi:hypothetical protein